MTRRTIEIIIVCCVFPLPKLNIEAVLLIFLICDATFFDKLSTAELACWCLDSGLYCIYFQDEGLSKYLDLLKEFVLIQRSLSGFASTFGE